MADDAMTDSDEIDRLRAENAALRERAEETERGGPDRRHGRWRWPVAIVLLVLGGLLLAGAAVLVWAARTVLDTDRYTETVAPLAQSPAIQQSVAVAAVTGIFARSDVETRVRDALPPKAAFLAPQIASEMQSFALRASERALATPQFQALWTQANRQAHQRIVPALLSGTGGRNGNVGISQGAVTIDLAGIVAQLKATLAARGLTFVNSVPDTVAGSTYVLFQSSQLQSIQTALRTLQTLAYVLPVLALLSFAGAIAAAPNRRRALLWLGVTIILAMLALGAVLALLRNTYLGSLGSGVLTPAAGAAFFDTLVRFLRNELRVIAAIGLVLWIAAVLAGPSGGAVRMREAVGSGAGALGLDLGGFSVWVDRYRRGLDAVVVVVAAVVLLASDAPTAGLVLGLAVAVLVAIAVVELLAHAHQGPQVYHGQPSM